MNKIKLLILLTSAAVCGIIAGRMIKANIRPSALVITAPANRDVITKPSSMLPRSVATKGVDKKILSVAQMNQESEKVWHADHTYMRNMWFQGSQTKINKVNDIIRKDFCELPQRLESAEAKRSFINAQSDDEKRYQYHAWTRARLYEMIRVLEVAKKHDLLPRVTPPPSQPEKGNPDNSDLDSKPPKTQIERAPDKVYQ